jgi:hypothetical protein
MKSLKVKSPLPGEAGLILLAEPAGAGQAPLVLNFSCCQTALSGSCVEIPAWVGPNTVRSSLQFTWLQWLPSLSKGLGKGKAALESSTAGGHENGRILIVLELSGGHLWVLFTAHFTSVYLKFPTIKKLKRKGKKAESKRMYLYKKEYPRAALVRSQAIYWPFFDHKSNPFFKVGFLKSWIYSFICDYLQGLLCARCNCR